MLRFAPVLCLVILQVHGLALRKTFSGAPIMGNHKPSNQDSTLSVEPGKPRPSETYPYHAILDNNYELHWKFNKTHITFETIVKTKGYVGFGLSPNGKMYPADVVIGWVKNGQSHFSDRHADGHYMPVKDTHQDWHLVAASESGDYTTLKMVRKLDTCDPQDRPILDGTTRVIYSYHPDDPASDDAIVYHGAGSRGTKSLLLLDPPAEDKNMAPMPDDLISLDFLNPNYTVPSADTTYHCTFWKMPDLGGKQHLIRFEPVIQKGHETLLHHMILYYCTGQVRDSMVGSQYRCYTQNSMRCEHVFIAWAIGGTGFDFPANAGFSMGTSDDPVYVQLETHYDNPGRRSDFVDSSGMRLFLTKQLRTHDAAVLETGVEVSRYQIIPPFDPGFLSSGYCHKSCLSEALDAQEIHVFSSLLHAHLAGVKLRTRHFRNGVELPPISEDNSYDFDFQEQRTLKEERIIKKGDSLITECVYDTTRRNKITYGGLSSRQEMCLSFLIYYPRMPLTRCVSRTLYKIPQQFAGRDVFNIVNSLDFSKPEIRAAFVKNIGESRIGHGCVGPKGHYGLHGRASSLPTIKQTYVKNQTCPVV